MKQSILFGLMATLATAPRNQCNNLNADTGAGGVRVCGRTAVGSTCDYDCLDGAARSATCESQNTWSTLIPCVANGDSDCAALSFDTGSGSTDVCTASASGSSCTFSCVTGETRTAICTNGAWSAPATCPTPQADCAALSFDTGSGSTVVCAVSASGSICSFSCVSGDARTATCNNGAWDAPETCPAGVECGLNNRLFLASQALFNVAGTAGVSQDRQERGRFRVEWQADTAPVDAAPGSLAASRLPRPVGQFELMAECCLDTAPTLEELPIQFVSGSATFQYDQDTLNWDFGPLFNPIYLTPPDSEPGIVIVSNAAGTAILQLIWVDKFVPAEGGPGPVRVRVQAEDVAAFPNGWPVDTAISVSATFNVKVAGSDTIYTYTTESGSFNYGNVGGNNVAVVAGAVVGLVGVFAAGAYMHRHRKQSTTCKESLSGSCSEGDGEELPDLEESDFTNSFASIVDHSIQESDFTHA